MRLAIGSIIILSLIVLFLFALFPSAVSVTRMVRINSTEDKIMQRISDLQTWKSWNELVYPLDTTSRQSMHPDSIRAEYMQVGDNEITLSAAGRDRVNILFARGARTFTGQFIIDTGNRPLVVIWTLDFKIKWYPWEKLASMFYDKQLGPLMEKSLLQLKEQVEGH